MSESADPVHGSFNSPMVRNIIAYSMEFWRWLATFGLTESIACLFFLWYYECDADGHQQQWVYKRYDETGYGPSVAIGRIYFQHENCRGSPVQFTDQSTIVPGYLARLYNGYGILVMEHLLLQSWLPDNPDVTHIFAGTAGSYTVRLTVTTSDSCSDFIQHTVNILASPLANFTYPSGNCMQQPVQFTDNSQTNGGGNIIQWPWNFGDPVSGSQQYICFAES